MRSFLVWFLTVSSVALSASASEAESKPEAPLDPSTIVCTYAGKTYSVGAFVCAAKGVGMVCGAPAVLGTVSPFAPGARPSIAKDQVGWQILQQNNDLIAIQAADPKLSRACDINPSVTP